jgi:hypothetical protein
MGRYGAGFGGGEVRLWLSRKLRPRAGRAARCGAIQ